MSVVLEPEIDSDEGGQPAEPRRTHGETLVASVIILLVMTVAQRLIGFGRGVLFCRWLDPEQLGAWDVAFGFLNLAAPLAVLGLPGTFGRYVEYFRHRGQFRTFLRRTTRACAVLVVAAAAIVLVWRDWFSQLIFGSPAESQVVVWIALCLAAIAVHNYLISLFIAVRRYRIVTVLQFVQSLGFALLSLALLASWQQDVTSVVIGFGVATLVSIVLGSLWLRGVAAEETTCEAPGPRAEFWAKLLPFAAWMWLTNLLINLFEVIDRYMIVHHSGMQVDEALRQVGYYHSSRIVPLLFVAVAGLLGSMITPHLSHDWEQHRREAVVRRLNLVLKLLLASLFAGAIVTLFVAPWLFGVAFKHKFEGGLVVLPWTLTYCVWFGTIAVAQNYLWCAERPGLCSVALAIGLALNVSVNLVLLPRYGLQGAVWATTLANITALVLTYVFSRRHGMHVDLGVWILTFAPLSLGLGEWAAATVLAALAAAAVGSTWVLVAEEKHVITAGLSHAAGRLAGWRRRLSRTAPGTL